MKFSIIVPVYNVEKYLEECVSSILKQDFTDYEVILVDDGSTDSSGIMCDEIAKTHRNFKVVHQQNSGVSVARNIGLSTALGEYIIFLDSDDFFIHKRCLAVISEATNSNADIIAFEARLYNKGRLQSILFNLDNTCTDTCSGNEYLLMVMASKSPYLWMSWQHVYRREWWQNNGFVFPISIKIAEDTALIFKCFLKARTVSVINEPLYAYRSNGDSITKTIKIDLIKDFLYVLDKNINYVNSAAMNPELKRELNNNFSFSYFTVLMLAENMQDSQERERAYKLIEEKKWICNYAIHGKHVILAQMVKFIGIHKVAYLIGIRRRVKKLLKGTGMSI